MTKHIALATLLAALGASVTWSSTASANCAMPAGYHIAVENNAVTICPSNHGHRACPDSGGMLRENRALNEVVELAAFCSGTGYSGPCYLDECVPPGTYRYGFATPYDCCASCCSTDYFQQITVEAPLPQGCTRTPGNDAPQAFAGSIPWGDDRTICEYGGSREDGGSPIDDGDDGGGCSISFAPKDAVFTVNALALILGLAMLARRRVKHP